MALPAHAADQQVCKGIGVTNQAYYRWRAEYAGMRTDQAMKELEEKNAHLKKLVAEQALDLTILREAASGNFRARRSARACCPSLGQLQGLQTAASTSSAGVVRASRPGKRVPVAATAKLHVGRPIAQPTKQREPLHMGNPLSGG